MAATTSMLWLIDSDDAKADLRLGVHNDRVTAEALARDLIPDGVLVPRGETTLDRGASVRDDEIAVGVYGRLAVIAGPRVAVAAPSGLPEQFLAARPTAHAYLIHTDTESAYGVFAQWDGGRLRRSFAADPVDITENHGLPYIFERAFWAGEHPLQYIDGVARDPQSLPFHPVEFAHCAAREWLGLEPAGTPDTDGDEGVSLARLPVSAFTIRPHGHDTDDIDPAEFTAPDARARSGQSESGQSQAGQSQSGQPRPDASQPEDPETAPPVVKVARWFGFGGKR